MDDDDAANTVYSITMSSLVYTNYDAIYVIVQL